MARVGWSLVNRRCLPVATTSSALKPLTIRARAWILAGSMLRLLVAVLPTLRSALRFRRDLVVENLALRQQLATLVSRRRPVIRPADRLFWILLRRLWSGWAESLAIVQPNTVVRWHRAGFRIYWNWLSRCGERSAAVPRHYSSDRHGSRLTGPARDDPRSPLEHARTFRMRRAHPGETHRGTQVCRR